MEPIPSQPLDLVGSSDETASNTSESVKDILHKHEGGMGRILMSGREKELLVKTERKEVVKSSALSVSEVTLDSLRDTERGIERLLHRVPM